MSKQIGQLPSGAPAQPADMIPIQRGSSTNFRLAVSDIVGLVPPSSSAWAALTGDLTIGQVIPWADAGISRTAAGALAIGNGTAGSFAGSLKLSNVVVASSGLTSLLIELTNSEGLASFNFVQGDYGDGPGGSINHTYAWGWNINKDGSPQDASLASLSESIEPYYEQGSSLIIETYRTYVSPNGTYLTRLDAYGMDTTLNVINYTDNCDNYYFNDRTHGGSIVFSPGSNLSLKTVLGSTVANSPSFSLVGIYETAGLAYVADSWSIFSSIGVGANGTSTLEIEHSGTSGVLAVNIQSGNLIVNSGQLQLPGNQSVVWSLVGSPAGISYANGAAQLAIGNGTAGNDEGTLFLSTLHAPTETNVLSFQAGEYVFNTGIAVFGGGLETTGGAAAYFSGNLYMSTQGTATSGANYGSYVYAFRSNYWNGSASAATLIQLQTVVASGTNAPTTLSVQNATNTPFLGMSLPSSSVFGWSSGLYGIGAMDTGISRTAAGSLAIGNGTAGNFSGGLKLTALSIQGALTDESASVGTSGQVLSSTVTGVQWVTPNYPKVVGTPIALTGLTADTSGTLLASAPAGLYRASFYVECTATVGFGASLTLDPTVIYSSLTTQQESSNGTYATPPGPFTLSAARDNNSIAFFFEHTGGDIAYDANWSGDSSKTYSFYATLERLN